MTPKKLIKTAEKRGWNVSIYPKYIGFQRISKEGQDFNVEIDIQPDEQGNYDFWTLRSKLIDYYDSFDIDSETYIWLDSDGHGKNGAPYQMIDVWNDMKDCHEKIWKLAMAY